MTCNGHAGDHVHPQDGHVPESKSISWRNSIARALTLRGNEYDIPGAVSLLMAAPKILCDTSAMDRRTWLAARAHGPDGSILLPLAAATWRYIRHQPWKTPLDLWLEKSGKLMPDESDKMWQKEMGHLLEPVVGEMYAFRSGNRVILDTYLYQHASTLGAGQHRLWYGG
jgi:hypothetical protein